jgi:hypothetical protein
MLYTNRHISKTFGSDKECAKFLQDQDVLNTIVIIQAVVVNLRASSTRDRLRARNRKTLKKKQRKMYRKPVDVQIIEDNPDNG